VNTASASPLARSARFTEFDEAFHVPAAKSTPLYQSPRLAEVETRLHHGFLKARTTERAEYRSHNIRESLWTTWVRLAISSSLAGGALSDRRRATTLSRDRLNGVWLHACRIRLLPFDAISNIAVGRS
jgi:hypothetical protein